jgi:hypothetical protein
MCQHDQEPLAQDSGDARQADELGATTRQSGPGPSVEHVENEPVSAKSATEGTVGSTQGGGGSVLASAPTRPTKMTFADIGGLAGPKSEMQSVVQYITGPQGDHWLGSAPKLLLVGPPGVGKASLAEGLLQPPIDC